MDWIDSLVSLLSVYMCDIIVYEYSHALILIFEKLHYFIFHRFSSD